MIRGTTPDITLRIEDQDVDLTAAEAVYATIVQGKNKITKTTEDLSIEARRVEIFLSQEETLSLEVGTAEVQLNWLYRDRGKLRRGSTKPAAFSVLRQLLDEVLP